MSLGVAPVPPIRPAATDITLLRGRRLVFARAAWVIVSILSLLLFAATLAVSWSRLHDPGADARASLEQLGLSIGGFALYNIAFTLALRGSFFAIGALIFWHKSDEPIGLCISLILVTIGATPGNEIMAALPAPWWLLATLLGGFGWTAIWIALYLFPDGRFVPRWTRVLAAVFVALQVYQLLANVFPGPPLNGASWPQPPDPVAAPITLGSCLFAQIYRYSRVSGPVQRQQTKWAVFGLTAALGIAVLINNVLGPLLPPLAQPGSLPNIAAQTIVGFGLALIPTSIGVAILRYRLWDIDVIISRTLVYGALTASVVGLYVLVVGALGALLQVPGNLLISLVATGLIAVLFQPLRDRLQRSVNRLMYGERDDPYRVLARLGQRLEAKLAPDAVLPTIVETVKEALKLPYAAITLKQDDTLALAAVAGEPTPDTLMIPLAYQGETIGQLLLGSRAPREPFTPADRRLLDDLARPAGVAAHDILLTADLERSRLRIVTAREEARRRLGSDLHDGLGHRLAGLVRKAETAANILDHDPATVRVLLAELTQQTKAAIAEVRGLAHQLHPPELELLGLAEALRERAQGYAGANGDGPHISIEAPETLPPLPAAVEVAAYYIALEALTNVQRHAAAQLCCVRLAVVTQDADDTTVLSALDVPILELEISDNGCGIPARTQTHGAGLGMRSMQERAAELGGRCVIEPAAGGGTRVYARLPCPHF